MDWFAQSLLGFGGWGITQREGFNFPEGEGDRVRHYVQSSKHKLFNALFLFDKMFLVGSFSSEIWELSSAENVDSFCSSHSEVIVSRKLIPLLAVNTPQSSKRS